LHEHSGKYWLLRPDSSLRQQVKSYFVVDVEARQRSKHELHLPDGYAELVFVLRNSYERAPIGSPGAAVAMKRSYLVGGRSHTIVTSDLGDVRVVGVKMEPRLLRELLATPLSEFRDNTVELRDLNDTHLLSLEERIAECASVAEIAKSLNAFFLGRRDTASKPDPLVEHLLSRIRAEKGGTPITQAARELGVDPRTLERRFSSWVGMSPKAYARVVRFKHAYHAFWASRSSVHANAALQSYLDGYYDQSHFIKEFRNFTGSSPAGVLTEHRPASIDVTNHLLTGDLAAA
jgi:AraC-like DNA-binding protein